MTKDLYKLHPPDWSKDCGHHGGHVKDVPQPHVRRFPAPPGAKDYDGTPLRREVRIQAVNYFHHWHVRVIEDDNPLWNPSPNVDFMRPEQPIGWTEPWDDAEGAGRSFTNSEHGDRAGARRWIASIIRRHFPSTTHRVRNDMNGLAEDHVESDAVKVARRAIYKREGD